MSGNTGDEMVTAAGVGKTFDSVRGSVGLFDCRE